ncbi:MAG: class I SAM-dependent methyltransferase [Planctomycetota bacterium]|nr:class I SAM-dependent methyltransferase [Planctomycetota bacterium]MCX8040462.1 class I SAM-dependent methyltransferase [Planctomycetota bacterium]MDW8373210.1 class I SAM-dependent methyltransferase [Planctomycetota bacterium]
MASDWRVLWSLLRGQSRAADHRARLEDFYAPQAEDYDRVRERMLHGRRELCAQLAALLPAGFRLAEFGAGTARNLAFLEDRLAEGRCWAVDLCPALLERARQRIAAQRWTTVEAVEADVTRWQAPEPLDAVLMSYSLTMIPDWFAAIDNALAQLKPGGLLAVVDFYVSRPHPEPGLVRHGWWERAFWPLWFGHAGVRPQPDLLPYLRYRAQTLALVEGRGRLPWTPWRAPYFRFLGRRA